MSQVVNKACTKICLIKIRKIWALKQIFNKPSIKKPRFGDKLKKKHKIFPQKILFFCPKMGKALLKYSPISAVRLYGLIKKVLKPEENIKSKSNFLSSFSSMKIPELGPNKCSFDRLTGKV